MTSRIGCVFYLLFAVLISLSLIAVLASGRLLYLDWLGFSTADSYALFAGCVLGLIPGVVVLTFGYFKAATRYFRDTPKEAAEKAVDDAMKKAQVVSSAYLKLEAAKAREERARWEAEKREASTQSPPSILSRLLHGTPE